MKFSFEHIPGEYILMKINKIAPVADVLIRHILCEKSSVLSLTIAPNEISAIVSTEWFAKFEESSNVWKCNTIWKIMTIDTIDNQIPGLEQCGILEAITKKFMRYGISIAVTSTYALNYVLYSTEDELKVISMIQCDPDFDKN